MAGDGEGKKIYIYWRYSNRFPFKTLLFEKEEYLFESSGTVLI